MTIDPEERVVMWCTIMVQHLGERHMLPVPFREISLRALGELLKILCQAPITQLTTGIGGSRGCQFLSLWDGGWLFKAIIGNQEQVIRDL